MTKEEVIAAIRKATEELGHVPSLKELLNGTAVSRHAIRSNFTSYRAALAACGLERQGTYRLPLKVLFWDWAEVVRKIGKIPTVTEYELHAKYSYRPLIRIYRGWRYVAAGLLEYAKEEGLEAAWKDVLDMVARRLEPGPGHPRTTSWTTSRPAGRGLREGQTVYGPPMVSMPMVFEPTNEAGVAVLFGAVARELGFAILHVQNGFPDCEAMREVEPGKCQRVPIEFEFESRNFLTHMHPVDGCKVIVCWRHNWPECPLEVVELREVAARLSRGSNCQNCQDCQNCRN